MSESQHDIIIAGGGLAGLSMGYFLKDLAPELDVLILERRERYEQDRHWGFWHLHHQPHPFEMLISTYYTGWKLVSPYGKTTRPESKRYHYCVIRSGDFYAHLSQTLGSWLKMGISCDAIRAHYVSSGEHTYRARIVFNALPPAVREVPLYQSFLGRVIETETPIFDAQQMTLMDFSIPQPERGFGFLYILPFSATRALIEPTQFTPNAAASHWYDERIIDFLKHHQVKRWQEIEQERAALPMAMTPCMMNHEAMNREGIPLGMRAGWMRPSTGYAFQKTMQLSRLYARGAATFPHLPPTLSSAYSLLARAMDAQFLHLMRRKPQYMPDIFYHWFDRVDADQMVDFLQDRKGLKHFLSVIAHARHKGLFLSHLWKS